MASKSETGFANNLNNFESLYTFCLTHADVYKPSNSEISLDALKIKLTIAKKELENVNDLTPNYKNAVDAQEDGFAGINQLATRIKRAFKAAGTSASAQESLASVIKKIKGQRTGKKLTPEEMPKDGSTPPDQISVAQLSYAARLNNLSLLITTLSQEPNYAPNEEELKVEKLKKQLSALTDNNKQVMTTGKALQKSRIGRNTSQFHATKGIFYTGQLAKEYLRSILPPGSMEYKSIASFKFSNKKAV